MKYLFMISIFCAALLQGCARVENKSSNKKLAYILVDAKEKVYHKDGTRSYKDYQPFETRTVDLLANYKGPTQPDVLSKYGGDLNHKTTATGFFHVKKINDRWWCIDPTGCKYINIALNSLNTGKSERSELALTKKFKSKQNWLSESVSLLHNYGFNCAGSWSDTKAIIEYNKTAERPMPYTVNWSFMSSYGKKIGKSHMATGHTGYPNDAIFVFDPEFKVFCDEHAKQLAEIKDDPNLFGHFSDNEMPFKISAIDDFISLPEKEYGHQAAEEWLIENGIDKDSVTQEQREEFMAYVGDTYFSIISKAIKKYDPNHMYIGSRFYSSEKDHAAFMKRIGKHLDIISCNYYNCWTPDSTQMSNWNQWTDKPFIVTEYYTKGEDSGMGNTSGAGWIVRTQNDRGLFYQNYTLALLESKNCVGWHYFKYMDNDPTAKGVDPSNIDANKGIVNADYKPWTPLLDRMKELNAQVYTLVEYLDRNQR